MRRRRKPASARGEFGDLAARVLVVGLAFTFASVFFANTLLGGALKALLPVGMLMVVGGGAVLWFTRRAKGPSAAAAPSRPARADQDTRTWRAHVGAPVDRTPTELLAVALEGDYWKPTCVNCGVKLVERESKRNGSLFWGCRHYRCKTTMPMKTRA